MKQQTHIQESDTHQDGDTLLASPLFTAIQKSITGYLMVLDDDRRVLGVNERLMRDLGIEGPECIIGNRPGEALRCIHAHESPDGCGTSDACASCGAFLTIVASQQQGVACDGECLATVRRESHLESHEFHVRGTPVQFGDKTYTVLVLDDISSVKRRESLEQVFFHDILNTISGLIGWTYLVDGASEEEKAEISSNIIALANQVARDIRDQQMLLNTEDGLFEPESEDFFVRTMGEQLASVFARFDGDKARSFDFDGLMIDQIVHTDWSVLLRVLVNLIKNAFEATATGGRIHAWYEEQTDDHAFFVNNPGSIPPEVQPRIFQRSFSTKARKGRGIGTYSVRLFVEQVLGGQVGFRSDEAEGTTFWVRIPKVSV